MTRQGKTKQMAANQFRATTQEVKEIKRKRKN